MKSLITTYHLSTNSSMIFPWYFDPWDRPRPTASVAPPGAVPGRRPRRARRGPRRGGRRLPRRRCAAGRCWKTWGFLMENWGKIPLKWMIWGYPTWWKPPIFCWGNGWFEKGQCERRYMVHMVGMDFQPGKWYQMIVRVSDSGLLLIENRLTRKIGAVFNRHSIGAKYHQHSPTDLPWPSVFWSLAKYLMDTQFNAKYPHQIPIQDWCPRKTW